MGVDLDKRRETEQQLPEDSSNSTRKAMSFVLEKSLPLPKHWDPEKLEELEFPDDLTKLSMGQLGHLMSLWTSVLAYVQFEVAKADAEKVARKNKWEFEKKKYYLKLSEQKGMTEKQKEAALVADSELAKLQNKYEQARAQHTLLQSLMGAYQKYYTVLSRELSRRGIGETPGPEPDDELDEDITLSTSLFKDMKENTEETEDSYDGNFSEKDA